MLERLPAISTPVTRRNRVLLTDRLCEKRVERRTKIYDRKCHGLYVSVTASGVATFYFQNGRGRCLRLNVHNPRTFTVDDARAAVYALRARIGAGENVFATDRQREAIQAKQGKTVDELIALRVAWMQTPERKADGEMRPRIETWASVASHFGRLIAPTLGKRLAAEVTRSDVAALSNAIVDGAYDGKPSVANARHMRRALSGLYNWAAEAGRDYVPPTCQPCLKLPKLPREHPRTRTLTAREIRIFWHGLDDDTMPWSRTTRLALKFALVTMLRSSELLGARRDELHDLDGDNPRFIVPLRRVKKRRLLVAPLPRMAVEIIKEALASDEQEYVFASPRRDGPLSRSSMHTALRGTVYSRCKRKGQTKTPGICALLGLKPFSPHDLRRTSATLAGDLGFSDSAIGLVLDHRATRDEDGARVASVTGRVYVHSRRLQQKREVLDGIDRALREIIGGEEPMTEQRAA
jgi:integrase